MCIYTQDIHIYVYIYIYIHILRSRSTPSPSPATVGGPANTYKTNADKKRVL